MIKVENITKRFKNRTVLKSISFQIEKGEFVSIIGPSGCGKTTLLKMINRLIKPTSGKIYINGENIYDKDPITLRRNMGYVIQQNGLFPHMTIKDNIEIIPKLEKKKSEEIYKRTIELMNMVDLNPDEYLNRYPSELSGGEQQRIGVARAFANDTDIVLMDEPFSALDPITRADLQNELLNLQSKLNKTIVFVTHDMDEALKLSNKICLMKDGEIIQFDEPEKILKEPENEYVESFVGKNRIWDNPEYIRAQDIMTNINNNFGITGFFTLIANKGKYKKIPKIKYDENITSILKILDENKAESLHVINENKKIIGIITQNELVAILNQKFIKEDAIKEINC
ncbi:ABC transporter ATP-binding protein [Brachyspira aalborgi]|jgi:osmoprotectant transport system ATP-binding protein|uniref:ABC transporter ATP-binding protein n=2 Tax=Brachyspira aalborgi TaxID=29522 RepID=A0A5C8EIP5_9SPIR|nr:ABC transporter ATP-binding protein [Brachyspira aalborgi]TXJ16754.1 ABC transporter ATP-binding protein [Brachyspira aalborgi]TXJ21624.1 ABC transporter ATP-binding protein [Brachyspira aalborgi]TXJ22157.1 ABC transporter ATP-binding protein [Brachyspira aalborgi]TXJ28114.1 ABC transporter ATP-binding protein [Brachyspira aalborgi]TXJ33698.1 ABC transporter ATP-binding protein [Brachyspira aalborgi]